MSVKIINRSKVKDICKKKFLTIAYVRNKANITKKDYLMASVVQVDECEFKKSASNKVNDIIRNVARVLKVSADLFTEDMSVFSIEKWEDVNPPEDRGHACLNIDVVKKLCNSQERPVSWALRKSNINYNVFYQMSQVKINRDGSLSAIKKPSVYLLIDLAKILKAPVSMLYIDLSKINVNDTNRKR